MKFQGRFVFTLSFILTLLASASFLTANDSGNSYTWHSVPLDDVWIHQVYARSIASGHPFQYNQGESETGSTSPLWAIILAPIHLFGLPVIPTSKFLCILFTAVTCTIAYFVAVHLGERIAGYIFAFSFTLLPYFTFSAVSGTEVPLFVFLIFLSTLLFLKKKLFLAGAISGFSILARPEGYILLFLFLLALIIDALKNHIGVEKSTIRILKDVAKFLLPSILVNALWIIFCFSVTGKPLPMTFYGKAEWYGILNFDQLSKISSLIFVQPFIGTSFDSTILKGIGVLIGLYIFTIGIRQLKVLGWSYLIVLGFFGPIYLYTLSIELPLGMPIGADQANSVQNFYFARYLLPGIALLYFVCIIGFNVILRKRTRTGFIIIVLIVCLATPSLVWQHYQLRNVYALNCQNIEELQVRAARWIAGNIPNNATIAVSDAGAMRYFGNHRIIDLVGLNTHRIMPFKNAINRISINPPENESSLEQFWAEEHPEYLAVTNGWHLPLFVNSRFMKIASFKIDRNTICGGSEIFVLKPLINTK